MKLRIARKIWIWNHQLPPEHMKRYHKHTMNKARVIVDKWLRRRSLKVSQSMVIQTRGTTPHIKI